MGTIRGDIRGEPRKANLGIGGLGLPPSRSPFTRAEASEIDLRQLSCFRGRRNGGRVLEGNDGHGVLVALC